MKHFDIVEVQKKIGYVFRDWELLFAAFTHSSYANEHGVTSYERLEFLGDSIVNFVVGEYLFNNYRNEDEGFLTKSRALLVSTKTLGAAVNDLDIIEYMRTLGGAIQDEVLKSVKVKADLFEAIVGAIMVDGGGLDGCRKFVLEKLSRFIGSEYAQKNANFKAMIYEKCAQSGKKLEFHTYSAGKNEFISELIINGVPQCRGEGSSKKKAEQHAANIFLTSQKTSK